jgi:glycerol kinase
MGVYLGIDHGGSTITSLVISDEGAILGRASVPTERKTPFPGAVEHDPRSFVNGSISAMSLALQEARLTWNDVRAVGIANQGETSMAWDADTQAPVAPALSWQDKRTSAKCDSLRDAGHDEDVTRISGLTIDPYYSASKFNWLAHATDAARSALERGVLRIGGSDAYLIDSLTGGSGNFTDPSTASRSALMNLDQLAWSPELAALFEVPWDSLPTIQRSDSTFGVIDHPDIPVRGIPIAANLVDAHAALFVHDTWAPMAVKATFGTGAFVETTVGSTPIRPTNGLAPFVGWQLENDTRYVLEGSVFDVGAAVNWLVDMGLSESAALTDEIARVAADTAGVTFVPTFSGIAAPHWNSDARAHLYGMSLKTKPEHVVRALLEGIASSVAEVVLMLLEEAGHGEVLIKADGGPSRNSFLMQLVADNVGLPIGVTDEPDITAFGIACLSAVSAGQFTLDDVRAVEPATHTFTPLSNTVTRERRRREWQAAIDNISAQHRT